MTFHNVDTKEAEDIASRFLSQHYSVRGVENVTLEDSSWLVTVLVSSPRMKKIRVRIDVTSGQVLGWQ